MTVGTYGSMQSPKREQIGELTTLTATQDCSGAMSRKSQSKREYSPIALELFVR